MHAVIFEVLPAPGRRQEYLDLAAALRPEVEAVDGFLSVERFASTRDAGKLLSLSLWRDEAALARWRRHARHRTAQGKGRAGVFRDYRIRVAEVVEEPGGSVNPVAADPRPRAAVLEIGPRAPGAVAAEGDAAGEAFESLTTAGKRLLLASWADGRAAPAWLDRAAAPDDGAGRRLLLLAVERDYGMFDRERAPRPEPAAGGVPA